MTVNTEENKILPIDDIRHCPLWMVISSQVIKSNNNRMYQGGPKKPKRTRSRTKQVTFLIGAFLDGKEIHRGTYREMQYKLNIPLNSLRNYVFRGHPNKETGYTFKKVGEVVK